MAVKRAAHVTLSGDVSGEYLIAEKGTDGSLLLAPDTGIEAIRRRLGTEPMSSDEFDRHFGRLPTDDEG